MKKILLAFSIMLFAFTTANAGGGPVKPVKVFANPHFVCSQTGVADDGLGTVTVNFKAVGLGNTVSTTISVSGNVSYTIKCWNSQGHLVPGQSGYREIAFATQNYTSDANGNVTGSFTLEVNGGKCRPNFHARFKVEISNIDWSNVTLTGNSDGTMFYSSNCTD